MLVFGYFIHIALLQDAVFLVLLCLQTELTRPNSEFDYILCVDVGRYTHRVVFGYNDAIALCALCIVYQCNLSVYEFSYTSSFLHMD